MIKKCAKCGEEKSFEEFNKAKGRKDGLNPYCKACCREYRNVNREKILAQKKAHYYENVEILREKNRQKYQKNKGRYRQSQVDYYSDPNNWLKRMLMKSKERAREVGLEHNLTIEDLPNPPKTCPYLNIELTYCLGKGQLPSNASLDRIDSEKGYVKGNVQIISRKANTMKNNASNKELLEFAKNVIRLSQST